MMEKESYVPSVWDRLMVASETSPTGRRHDAMTFEQLRTSVARGLEDLLNTRVALDNSTLKQFPACQRSILNYGLRDFAALCLTSSDDQKIICDNIKEAIERFEPRLHNVDAEILIEHGATNRLDFIISGTLKTSADSPRIEFNAMLQPSTLRYSVGKPVHRKHAEKAKPQ